MSYFMMGTAYGAIVEPRTESTQLNLTQNNAQMSSPFASTHTELSDRTSIIDSNFAVQLEQFRVNANAPTTYTPKTLPFANNIYSQIVATPNKYQF